MKLSDLSAISPIDGRYRTKVKELAPYFSEFGLIRYRVLVEIEYFIALCKLPLPQLSEIPMEVLEELPKIYRDFSEADAAKVKEFEKTST